ncbi:MAG: DUF3782 domain-containing protein [Thermoprotei archaeon]
MSVKEELLRLLKEDEEFRLAVAGLLGFSEIIRRSEENEKRTEALLQEIRQLREDFNQEIRQLREDFNQEIRQLREDFNQEIRQLREDFNRLYLRFETTLGNMGHRWGRDLERMVLESFKEVLEREGIEPAKVEPFNYVDGDGSITGLKGRTVQVDILLRDGKLTVIEVKSFARLENVDHLYDVVGYVEKILKKKVDAVYLVAVNVDNEVLDRAKQLGFKVIYGSVSD